MRRRRDHDPTSSFEKTPMNKPLDQAATTHKPTNALRSDARRRGFLKTSGIGAATASQAAPAAAPPGKSRRNRKAEGLGMPWEDQYGHQ